MTKCNSSLCIIRWAPALLELPTPVSASLSLSHARLAPAADDATLPGVGLVSTASLRLMVDFEGRSEGGAAETTRRELTGDERVQIKISPAEGCAVLGEGGKTLSVLRGAVCTHLSVTATVRFGEVLLVASASVRVARVSGAKLDFVSDPLAAGGAIARANAAVTLTQLGRVQCSEAAAARFHAAGARMRVFLDDEPGKPVDVSPHVTFRSEAPAVVRDSNI